MDIVVSKLSSISSGPPPVDLQIYQIEIFQVAAQMQCWPPFLGSVQIF